MSGSTVSATPVGGTAANVLNFWFKPGLAGGQTGYGGVNAGDIARFDGASPAAAPDVGRVHFGSPMECLYLEGNTTPAEQIAFRWRPTGTVGAYIGGFMQTAADITYTNSFFIYALMAENGIYRAGIGPGFAAFTNFNVLCRIVNAGNFDLVQALVMNVGVTHERSTAGTSTTPQTTGVSFSAQGRTSIFGAILTYTAGMTGLRFTPTYSTVAFSTVNFGPLQAVDTAPPAPALFQPGAGAETATRCIGLYYRNHAAFGGNIQKAAVLCEQASATNAYCIQHTGTAQSTHGGDFIIPRDVTGFLLGIDQDVRTFWGASGFWALQFNSAGGASGFDDQFRVSNPGADRFELSAALAASEISFVYNKGSFGEGGAAGNNKWRFVAQAETVTIGGGYAQFLLTQAANDTIDAPLSQYFAWALNAPTPTIGTGSIVDGGALLIGGNISSGTNRYGVLILSNPTGGTLNYALRLPNGDARFDARVDINNPIALGAGAAATLGTIGAPGPVAAAQAIWVEIDVGGVPTWIAGWR